MKFFTLTSLVLILAIAFSGNANALSYKIIASVNGEAISNVQLRDRVKIIMNSTGMPNTAANRKKVAREAFDVLINETLQAQEAKQRGIEVTEEIMKLAVEDLEKRNKIASGGFKKFINSKGLSYQATLDQIKAGMLWKKTVSRLFRENVEVTDEEVKARASDYNKKDIIRTVDLSEIVIPVEYNAEDATYDKAEQIAKRARGGESFESLAKQYSMGKTAKQGGRIGILLEKTVVPPLNEEVARLKNGQVGEPIRVDDLFVILKLNKRKIDNPASDKAKLREKVVFEKLELKAKKFVKELRQKALIDKRYKYEELHKLVN